MKEMLAQVREQDNDSHFHESLLDWRELNLAPAFIRFAKQADGLSASMALLVHNWKEITDIWLEAVDSADDEALKPLLEYVQLCDHVHDMVLIDLKPSPKARSRLANHHCACLSSDSDSSSRPPSPFARSRDILNSPHHIFGALQTYPYTHQRNQRCRECRLGSIF